MTNDDECIINGLHNLSQEISVKPDLKSLSKRKPIPHRYSRLVILPIIGLMLLVVLLTSFVVALDGNDHKSVSIAQT